MRQALLRELIEIDLEYRRRLGEMATWADYAEQFPEALDSAQGLPSGPAEAHPRATPAEQLPRSLGRFELLERLGVGSFGTVYKAREPNLNRLVAIKVPRQGLLADPEDEQRFLREAQSTARIRHPGIVPVHEVATVGGIHCIVSEYIEARTLAAELAGGRWAPRRAAELIAQIADALECAHRHGVIHRDIKPHNILLDANGWPHVTDFGLARREEASVVLTQEGQVLGTPAYMSPEQARGQAHAVDGRSDVYSLGVVFYQLLTGELPFRGSVRLLLHQVVHDEPRPPRRISVAVPRDLETICLKALAKESRSRYARAGELAADLRRWLAGTPIRARPCSATERLVRWCRRNPVVAGWMALAGLFLLVGTGVSTYFIGQATEQQREADRARKRTQTEKGLSDRRWYLAEMRLARPYWEGNQIRWLREILEGQLPERTGDIDFRGFEWFYWNRLCHFPRTIEHPPADVYAVAVSRDGRWLATGATDHRMRLFDAGTGKLHKVLGSHTDLINRVAFDPNGRFLASASNDCTARIWDLADGTEKAVFRDHVKEVSAVAFSPDGELVASAGGDANAYVWESATGKVRFVLNHAKPGIVVAFSPNGRWLATGCYGDAIVRVFDAASGRAVRELAGPCPNVASLAFSPDSQWLAGAGSELQVWNVITGELAWQNRDRAGQINRVAFSSAGDQLATADSDRTVRIVDRRTGQILRLLKGHTHYVRDVAFDPKGESLLSCGHDGAVYLWDLSVDPEVLRLGGHPTEVNGVAFSPDGKRLAAACGTLDAPTDEIKVWDVAARKEALSLQGHKRGVNRVSYSHDGQWLASASDDHTVGIWRAQDGQVANFFRGHQGPVWCAVFSPDGRRLASVSNDGSVKVWNRANAREVFTYRPHFPDMAAEPRGPAALGAAFSSDGQRLAASWLTWKDQIKILDVARGQALLTLSGHTEAVWNVAFGKDDRLLASASNDGTVRIWDAQTGAPIHVLKGHTRQISDVSFSPDGRRLASASWDGTVKLWDVESGQETLTLPGNSGRIFSVAFSADGRRLAAGCWDKAVRVWDAPNNK